MVGRRRQKLGCGARNTSRSGPADLINATLAHPAPATLPAGGANFQTYITGFEFSGLGATGASVVLLTMSNLSSPSPTYIINVPAGVTTSIPTLVVEFSMPIPANALNTAIAVSVPSLGAGDANAAVVAHGFQLPSAAKGDFPMGGIVKSGNVLHDQECLNAEVQRQSAV